MKVCASHGYLASSRYLPAKLSKGVLWNRTVLERGRFYSAVSGATLSALMEVVFPPQSTYWYISWDTCSAWPKYVVVTVTLRRRRRAQTLKTAQHLSWKSRVHSLHHHHDVVDLDGLKGAVITRKAKPLISPVSPPWRSRWYWSREVYTDNM